MDSQQSLAQVQPAGVQLTTAEVERDLYRSVVLQLNETEQDIGVRIIQQALVLGIRIPYETSQSLLDPLIDRVDSLSLESASEDLTEPSHSQLGTSHTISTPSGSSPESKLDQRPPSLTTSIPSVDSAISASSDLSNQSKPKRGFQRFAAFRSRKKKDAASPVSTPASPSRRSSSNIIPSDSRSCAETLEEAPQTPVKRSDSAGSIASYSDGSLNSVATTSRTEIDSHEPHPTLKRLRALQLDQQLRFISYRGMKFREFRNKQELRKKAAFDEYEELQYAADDRHGQQLSRLESRQLVAEARFREDLGNQKSACNTRIRHMEDYCNPNKVYEGMPARNVTARDIQNLELQYQQREQMDTLHAGKINVLRERQTKEVNTLLEKHEQEFDKLAEDYERELEKIDEDGRDEEYGMKALFEGRRIRMIARWNLAEDIQRKTLQDELGGVIGPLPQIHWGDAEWDEEKADEEMMNWMAKRGIRISAINGHMVERETEVVNDGGDQFYSDNVI